MDKLLLKDLYFGKIDAYNEYLEYGTEIFQDTFFEYPNFNLESVLNGKRYYICGDKGTGKTMLLKYAEAKALNDPVMNFSQFIRFKKEIDEEQRQQIKKASTIEDLIIDGEIPEKQGIDCILAWQVFLIKAIVNRLGKTEGGVFSRSDEHFRKLSSIVSAAYNEPNSTNTLKKIVPKIKQGNIQFNVAEFAKISLDLEWDEKNNAVVPFSFFGKRVLDLYSLLKPVPEGKIYIFIDELELSLKRTKQYERDVSLIHDLILAIQYLNEISKTNEYKVYIIAAIRNEVYKEAQSKGVEINKPISDFGTQISWRSSGGNIRDNPILRMIEKRIRVSERIKKITSDEDVWQKYFTQKFQQRNNAEIPIHNYLLNQTWNKPRDIIRLLSIIQEKYAKKNFIDQAILESIRQEYAEQTWAEFQEELTVKYTTKQLDGIKKVLTGIKIPFTREEFLGKAHQEKDFFPEVELLLSDEKKIPHVLRDLYDLGIVGNYGKYPRFSFKGEADIAPNLPITFHYPLVRFFKAEFKEK